VFADFGTSSHWLWNLAGLLLIPALVLLNGLFVAAEFSLVSVRKTRIEELIERGVKSARLVESAMNAARHYPGQHRPGLRRRTGPGGSA
jgi:hypothetical protein